MRRGRVEVWKQPEECCGHGTHSPGRCFKCNCGESEMVRPHGHVLVTTTSENLTARGQLGQRLVGAMPTLQ